MELEKIILLVIYAFHVAITLWQRRAILGNYRIMSASRYFLIETCNCWQLRTEMLKWHECKTIIAYNCNVQIEYNVAFEQVYKCILWSPWCTLQSNVWNNLLELRVSMLDGASVIENDKIINSSDFEIYSCVYLVFEN